MKLLLLKQSTAISAGPIGVGGSGNQGDSKWKCTFSIIIKRSYGRILLDILKITKMVSNIGWFLVGNLIFVYNLPFFSFSKCKKYSVL